MKAKDKAKMLDDLARMDGEQIQQAKEMAEKALKEGDETAQEALDIIADFEKENAEEATVNVRALLPTNVDGTKLAKGQETKVTERQYKALAARLEKIAMVVILFGLLAIFSTKSVRAADTQYNGGSLITLIANGVVTTNGSISSGGSNYTSVASFTKYDEFLLDISFALTGTGTDPLTFTWRTGGTATGLATVGPGKGSFTVAANGTTVVNWNTNVYLGCAGYWCLTNILGSTNNHVTNLNVKLRPKSSRRGT